MQRRSAAGRPDGSATDASLLSAGSTEISNGIGPGHVELIADLQLPEYFLVGHLAAVGVVVRPLDGDRRGLGILRGDGDRDGPLCGGRSPRRWPWLRVAAADSESTAASPGFFTRITTFS